MRRKTKTLVTGGAGFLGSHLCDRLVERGHQVVCVDNFFTGQYDNVAHLAGNPRFEVVEHDVVEPLSCEVDDIYNLACPASPVHYQYDPVHTLKTSVLGTMNLLGLAKSRGARMLLASTSEVYGDPEVLPMVESYRGNVNTIGPRACYDEGKRCAETLMYDYHRCHGVGIRIARIFNTYGPRMHPEDGRVVSNFIVQALKGEPLTIYGDGSQTRAFCYVDDLIDGLMALMNLRDAAAGPVNLGNADMFTVLELAELVRELTGSRSHIVRKPLPVDDPKRRRPDISLARTTLGWQPRVPLRDGLAKTIEYFDDLLAGQDSRPIALPRLRPPAANDARPTARPAE